MRLSELIVGPLMSRTGTPADELAASFGTGSGTNVIAFPSPRTPAASPVDQPDQPAAASRRPTHQAIGTWRIVDMDAWDLDAIELLGPARIEVTTDGLGQFRFIAVEGDIDWKSTTTDADRIEFSWTGNDEGDPVSGRGFATVDDVGELVGHLYFHHGDDSEFRAVRHSYEPPRSAA